MIPGHVRNISPLRTKGFTLLELMVTIAIAAILLTLAAPSFVSFRQNSQLTAAANTFLAAAAAARSEAMKRQLVAFMRPTGSGGSTYGNNWANGWLSFVDGDWDGKGLTANLDITIGKQDSLPTNVTVASDTTVADGTSKFVAFSASGYLCDQTGSTVPQRTVTFTNGVETRLVSMEGSGRMRVCNPTSDTTCGAAF